MHHPPKRPLIAALLFAVLALKGADAAWETIALEGTGTDPVAYALQVDETDLARVAKLDTDGTIIATVDVGNSPSDFDLERNGRYLYVISPADQKIARVRTEDMLLIGYRTLRGSGFETPEFWKIAAGPSDHEGEEGFVIYSDWATPQGLHVIDGEDGKETTDELEEEQRLIDMEPWGSHWLVGAVIENTTNGERTPHEIAINNASVYWNREGAVPIAGGSDFMVAGRKNATPKFFYGDSSYPYIEAEPNHLIPGAAIRATTPDHRVVFTESEIYRTSTGKKEGDLPAPVQEIVSAGDPPHVWWVDVGGQLGSSPLADLIDWPGPFPEDGHVVDFLLEEISWTSHAGAAFYDIYLGRAQAAVESSPVGGAAYFDSTDQSIWRLPEALDGGEWFWRIDRVNGDGSVTKGEVWSFEIISAQWRTIGAPLLVTGEPANGAYEIEIYGDTLLTSWLDFVEYGDGDSWYRALFYERSPDGTWVAKQTATRGTTPDFDTVKSTAMSRDIAAILIETQAGGRQVLLWRRDPASGDWSHYHTIDTLPGSPPPTTRMASVSISEDFVAIGALLYADAEASPRGAVYLFSTHDPSISQLLLAEQPAEGDYFGSTVQLSGGILGIGASRAADAMGRSMSDSSHIAEFDPVSGQWLPAARFAADAWQQGSYDERNLIAVGNRFAAVGLQQWPAFHLQVSTREETGWSALTTLRSYHGISHSNFVMASTPTRLLFGAVPDGRLNHLALQDYGELTPLEDIILPEEFLGRNLATDGLRIATEGDKSLSILPLGQPSPLPPSLVVEDLPDGPLQPGESLRASFSALPACFSCDARIAVSSLPPGLRSTGNGTAQLEVFGTPSGSGTHWIAMEVSDGTGNSTARFLPIQVLPEPRPPVILRDPVSVTTRENARAVFAVTVEDNPSPLSFVWRKDGQVIPGANASRYAIRFPTADDQGSYSVEVSNASGSVTSSPTSLTVVATTRFQTGEWTQYGGSPGHSMHVPESFGDRSLTKSWSNLGRQADNTIISGGTVIFQGKHSMSGYLVALDLYSGKELWQYKPDGGAPSAPVAFDGRIYFFATNAQGRMSLHCVSEQDGALIWENPLDHGVSLRGDLTVSDEGLWCQLNREEYHGNTKYLVDLIAGFDHLGNQRFEQRNTPPAFKGDSKGSLPSLHGGLIHWIQDSRALSALPSTGELVSSAYIGREYVSGRLPIGAGEEILLYHNSSYGGLDAIDITRRRIIWNDRRYGLPAVANGLAYAVSNRRVYAIDPLDGMAVHQSDSTSGVTRNPPLMFDDTAITQAGSNINVIDLNSGEIEATPLGGTRNLAYTDGWVIACDSHYGITAFYATPQGDRTYLPTVSLAQNAPPRLFEISISDPGWDARSGQLEVLSVDPPTALEPVRVVDGTSLEITPAPGATGLTTVRLNRTGAAGVPDTELALTVNIHPRSSGPAQPFPQRLFVPATDAGGSIDLTALFGLPTSQLDLRIESGGDSPLIASPSIDPLSGVLSFDVAPSQVGFTELLVSAADALGRTASVQVSILVAPPPTPVVTQVGQPRRDPSGNFWFIDFDVTNPSARDLAGFTLWPSDPDMRQRLANGTHDQVALHDRLFAGGEQTRITLALGSDDPFEAAPELDLDTSVLAQQIAPSHPIQIVPIPDGPGMLLEFSTESGLIYSPEWSEDLKHWTPVPPAAPAAGTRRSIALPPELPGNVFFRILSSPTSEEGS